MRVGIIGDTSRAAAWEKHLRPLTAVREVVITRNITDIEDVQACILLDDSDVNLDLLADVIRLGVHSYLVANLPTETKLLKKIYHLSQESDVRVQFSHWPTLSPATQWMKQQLPKPGFIEVIKEHSHLSYTEHRDKFSRYWMDDIAWIVKWMDISTHRVEVQQMADNTHSGIRIYMKFENGASASFFYLATGSENRHRRIASGSGLILDCDVERQSVKKTRLSDRKQLTVETQTFDATKAAELSANLFFKAIKQRRETAFTAYDALKTSQVIDSIRNLLKVQI